MSFRLAAFAVACLPLGACATGFSESELRDYCPSVSISKEARSFASYPGGEPGRNSRDYTHIAVITGATSTCYADAQGNMVADINVSYAVEPGPLYRGVADNTLFASTSHGGRDTVRKVTGTGSTSPDPGTTGKTTAVVRGLVIGAKGVEDENLTIVVGFQNPES